MYFLNPLRVGLVKSMAGLDRYRWSGHSILMGRYPNDWQARDYVLSRFGKKEKAALDAYRQYISEGVEQGKRPELVGGGLNRSLGGWAEVKALRRLGIGDPADDRILGSGEFVEQIIKEADARLRSRLLPKDYPSKIKQVIITICKEERVNIKELLSGSRRRPVTAARLRIAQKLVEELGVPLAETARQLGVSTPAISLSLARAAKRKVS